MAVKNFEIVRQGNDIVLKARVKHGPGDLHTLRMSQEDMLAARNAFRGSLNRYAGQVAERATASDDRRWMVHGEAREEDMTGVYGDDMGFSPRKFVRIGPRKTRLRKFRLPRAISFGITR